MKPNARILSESDVASRLGHSRAWFYANRGRLEQDGLPKRIRLLNGRDSVALENWLDEKSGVSKLASVEAKALEAIHGRYHA